MSKELIEQQARIEQLTNFIRYAQVSSGVCCCGESMEGHPSHMTCGHSPVDMWDYHSSKLLEAYPDDLSALRAHFEDNQDPYEVGYKAGAASRDAEIAELKNALGYDWDRFKASQKALREHMQMVAQKDAEIAELVAALRLWKLASNNSEESELDDMACYCVPMPLFCDADEATEAALAKVRKP